MDRPTSACRDSFLVISLVFQVLVVNDCLSAADRQEGVIYLSLERAGGTLAATYGETRSLTPSIDPTH